MSFFKSNVYEWRYTLQTIFWYKGSLAIVFTAPNGLPPKILSALFNEGHLGSIPSYINEKNKLSTDKMQGQLPE